MPRYLPPTSRYLIGLAIACLITVPYLGVGSLVIWLLTALTLRSVAPSLDSPSDSDNLPGCGTQRRRP